MSRPAPHALVTGAGTGIGLATATRLARRGDQVALHYRSHGREAESLAQEIRRSGGVAFSAQADLLEPAALDALTARVEREFPSLETLVLNAGEYPRRSFEQLSDEDFERTLRLNLWSPFALARRLLPLLRRADPAPARVVLLSSVIAFNGSEHGADYAASKAGLEGLGKSMARELGPRILVNMIAPGAIDTAILAHESPQEKEARAQKLPLRRLGQAEDVAKAIDFLTSPSADYLTGTTVHVNGGLRMD